MKTYEVTGTYGSNLAPCTVFVAEKRKGLKWYACEDSVNVNATYDDINEGCDVEELQDVDCFTWPDKINSQDELETAVNF